MPREHLIRLIREDRGLAKDPRRLRALLSDHCPAGGARLRALLEAQSHGIVGKLEAAGDTPHRDILFARMASHLFEEAGLRQDLCAWAVETWHLALTAAHVTVEQAESPAPKKETAKRGPSKSFEPRPTPHPSGPDKPGDFLSVALGGGVKMDMLWIPPGEFNMAADDYEDEKWVHQVRLSQGFCMGKYAVTQEQWERMIGSNPSHFKGAQNPVERVSWNDCQEFVRKLNSEFSSQRSDVGQFRLPTEAEWEYACRAGATTRFHNGDGDSGLGSAAWYDENSGETTHPVGQKAPNAWGLYDMHGNVSEWCEDWYAQYASGAVTDPTGPSSGSRRVFRGGGWDSYAGGCRVAFRVYSHPDHADNRLGFRSALPPGFAATP